MCVCIYKGIFSEVADFVRAVSDLINISLAEVNGISEAAGLETYFLALQILSAIIRIYLEDFWTGDIGRKWYLIFSIEN